MIWEPSALLKYPIFWCPCFFQVPHCKVHALVVVDPHVGCGGIPDDMVIVEDSGRARGLKILHPRLAEGKAEDKSPGVIILQHEHIKRCLALELHIHRDYIHLKPGRFAHLPETHHNIIRKVVRLQVFDVVLLGNDAQTLCGFLIAPEFGIAQFHGSLQYLFL